MNIYIISLPSAKQRHLQMEKKMQQLSISNYEFVEAINGNAMTVKELEQHFDCETFKRRYSQIARPGEIGCTLSHQKCFSKLFTSNLDYVLILEDDVTLCENESISIIESIEDVLKNDMPTVILFSGWFWWTKKVRKIDSIHSLVEVYDALLTHSYVINKKAAEIFIEEQPFIKADDWNYLKKKGVKIYGITPHIFDQEWNNTPSTITNIPINYTSDKFKYNIFNFIKSLPLKFLRLINHFEKMQR